MKARIKATGEVVDVIRPLYESRFYRKDDPIMDYRRDELEFIEDSIDWEQRRFELVKAAMQGIFENSNISSFKLTHEGIAQCCVKQSDAIIAEYKKGGNK